MQITQPTDNDMAAILAELDQDGDSTISKDEFEFLIIKVLEKMYESEIELRQAFYVDCPRVEPSLAQEELDERKLFSPNQQPEGSESQRP